MKGPVGRLTLIFKGRKEKKSPFLLFHYMALNPNLRASSQIAVILLSVGVANDAPILSVRL